MLILHIFSSVFDFLCVANIIFLCGGLAKFACTHARSLEGTLLRTAETNMFLVLLEKHQIVGMTGFEFHI